MKTAAFRSFSHYCNQFVTPITFKSHHILTFFADFITRNCDFI